MEQHIPSTLGMACTEQMLKNTVVKSKSKCSDDTRQDEASQGKKRNRDDNLHYTLGITFALEAAQMLETAEINGGNGWSISK